MSDGPLHRPMHHFLVGGQIEIDPREDASRLHRATVVDAAFDLETPSRVRVRPEARSLGRDVYPAVVVHPFRKLSEGIREEPPVQLTGVFHREVQVLREPVGLDETLL